MLLSRNNDGGPGDSALIDIQRIEEEGDYFLIVSAGAAARGAYLVRATRLAELPEE